MESQTGSVSVASSSFMAAASFSQVRRRTSERMAFGRDIARGSVQPAGENGAIRQLAGIVGKCEEDLLRDILGQIGVVQKAERG